MTKPNQSQNNKEPIRAESEERSATQAGSVKKQKKSKKKEGIQDVALKNGRVLLEDQLVRNFDDVIESNEKIIQGFKPNKTKIIASRCLLLFLCFGVITIFSILGVWLDPTISTTEAVVGTSVIGGLFVLLFVLVLWFSLLYYKNTFYVYTNKRLIIRTGIIGVDYHCLDMENIGASNVCVSFLDKILRKNTGSIKFGSNSSPIGGEGVASYGFMHIENPYQVYKEIKEYMQSRKEGK